ncbi:MAG TPA: hypothetical protein VNZ49_13645 [Bacteroidia bacterium]|jgi:hypothetical protein|nr:hypothetical protein [Bacteroidia bacterium]
MKKVLYLFFFLYCIEFSSFAQVPAEFIEKNAVEIKNRKEANDSIYKVLKDYKAILIGEMHGTKEPAEFFLGIVKSLMKNGKKVVVGLEIPVDGIDFTKDFTVEDLKKAPAFYSTSPDGRQCIAWAEMLVELKKMNAEILCFDLSMEYKGDKRLERDSVMASTINDYLKKDTSKTFVSLTGNISNMLIPYKKIKTMVCYLTSGNNSCLKGRKILSVNCLYGKGTMYNWMNNGYKLREADSNAPYYEYATSYDNFLFAFPDASMPGYNGFLFSKTITASGPLVETK